MRLAKIKRGVAAAFCTLIWCRGDAIAQSEPAPLEVSWSLDRDVVTANYDVTSAFTEKFRRRLSGGLTSRALIEAVLRDSRGTTLAVQVRSCELRLDVWDEVVYGRIRDATRLKRRTYALIDDALRACGVVRVSMLDLPLLRESGGYELTVTVALNPVSPELLERTREFVADPRGTGGARSRAFFGAVARLFRSESEVRGSSFVFRSRRLNRPRREAP